MNGYNRNDDDGSLIARVEGKELVIRIGIDRLTWCLRHCGGPFIGSRIKKEGFAKDLIVKILREDGVGGTPIWELLEKMTGNAADQGSIYIKRPKKRSNERRSQLR